MHRIGFGYDIHRLESGRKLILGGAEVPFSAGLFGHSDGDVLVHAVIDAVLGAIGEGDIGVHFPDTDALTEGAKSTGLLASVMGLVRSRGGEIVNVDSVIITEEPKMGPHIAAMKAALCPLLGLPPSSLGIKAKTNEGLGPVGEKRAIACCAVVLITLPD